MLPSLMFVVLQLTTPPAQTARAISVRPPAQTARAVGVRPPAQTAPAARVPPTVPGVAAAAAGSASSRAAPAAAPSTEPRRITQYRIQQWTDIDGLPQNSIHSIAQTTDRFLWLASEQGLIRFDGERFTIFNPANTPALERSQMLALAAGADGSLRVGTAAGGLITYQRGAFATLTERDGLPSDRVQAVAVAASGIVWAGTNRGLARVEADGSITTIGRQDGLPDDDVLALLAQPNGSVWVGTKAGLARITERGVVGYTLSDGLPAAEVRSLAAAREGGVWVGTSGGGVAHFDDRRFRALDERLASAIVLSITEDETGALWIGTNGGGLHRWTAGRLETLDNANGGADLVWSLLEDADGGLWIGTNGRGLFHLRRTPFLPLGAAEGLSGDIALAVLQTRAGDRWIGTAGNGLNRVSAGGEITRFGEESGLAASMVLSLGELPNGDVLIGSHNGSLTRFRAGRFTQLGGRYGLRAAIMAILSDEDGGGYWLGTTGGVHHVRGERVTHVSYGDGLADDFVMTLHRSSDGALWVGTRQGVSRIADGRVTAHAAEPQLAGIAVAAFFAAGDGRLWAATQGRGIVQIDSAGAAFLDSSHGLCEDLIHAIVEDDRGAVWMSSNKGVLRLARHELDAFFSGRAQRVHCTLYDRADGLRSREANGGFMPAAARLADGTLMFPTMQGVVTVDPRAIAPASAAASAILQTAILGHDTVSLSALQALVVSTADRDLEVHFTSPSFHAPDRLRFRFRLVGFDAGWRDAGSRRAAYYTNLPPGEYEFRAAVANEDGVWHETAAALPVVVPARIHELWWFRLLGGIVAVIFIVWLHRRRVAGVRSNAARLAVLVEERTRAEERYRDLFENASDMVFTTDCDGRVTSWNAQAQELTGWRKAEALGAPIGTLLPEFGEVSNAARREVEFARRNGVPAIVEITSRAILENGRTIGYQLMGRDVREWRQIQTQLEQAARMEAVGQLAGGVAHDFNNLLTVISSYGALVEADLPQDSALRSDVEQIRVAAESAAGLTRQLLAFSRQQVLQPRIVDVNDETLELVAMLRRVIGAGITLETDLAAEIWKVRADPGQLEQALMNLALNARDAMPDGGTLRFRTCNTELDAAAAERFGLAEGRYVGLTVEDTGGGIEPSALPHLFEPFFTTKEAGRGTGLGLATAYGVVKQSGGQIVADSEPGVGARFCIYLPVATATPSQSSRVPAARPAPDAPRKATILLVEDEEAVNRLARRILGRKGFDVRAATNGPDALRILDDHGPVDLLLTDLIMPGMGGRELGRAVRSEYPATRVLYMSGYTEDEVIRGGVLPAGEQFIGKPFTPTALVDAVAAAMAAEDVQPILS